MNPTVFIVGAGAVLAFAWWWTPRFPPPEYVTDEAGNVYHLVDPGNRFSGPVYRDRLNHDWRDERLSLDEPPTLVYVPA
jgi:hypothetical protein